MRTSARSTLVLLAAAGIASPAFAADPTPGYPEPVIQWGVQKDETCDDIAKAVYGSAKHALLVLRYNRVDCSKGKTLTVGTTLVLPASVTSLPTAKLRSMNPAVNARAPGGSWSPAAPGLPLQSKSGVNTLETGRADIEFIDRTRVFLASNTLVIVYGTASQSAVSKTPPPAVEVEAGELKAGLAALRGGSNETVEVAVPGGGRVSASSRETIVERKGERTTVGVYDGRAKVSAAGKAVDVPLNHGTRFTGKGAPTPPRPLPPAPEWESSTSALVLAAPTGSTIQARWKAVANTKAYRVEVSRDKEFRDLIAREEVPGNVLSFEARSLPDGRYYVAVRAIDNEEYLGVAAKRDVDVLHVEGSGVTLETGKIRVNPYGTIALTSRSKPDLALDAGPFGPLPPKLDFRDQAPTKLRFRPSGSESAYEVAVEYTEVGADVTASPEAAPATGVAVRVTFRGLDGIDIGARVKPKLRVQDGQKVSDVPLTKQDAASGAGVFGAILPPPASGTHWRIDVVDDRGMILGTGHYDARAPQEKPVIPPPAVRIPAIGFTTENWQSSPTTSLFFWSPTAPNAASAAFQTGLGEGDPTFRIQAAASGSIDRFGIDALIRTDQLGRDAHDEGGWAGLRVRAFRLGLAELEGGFAARVGFPLSAEGPAPRLEPSFAIGGVSGRWTWLGQLGARIRLTDNTATFMPDGQFFLAAGGTVNPMSWLRLGAVLDAHLLYTQGVDPEARGGLSLGVEAGTLVYGGIWARLSPWSDDGNGIGAGPFTAQVAVGVRAN